MLWKEAVSSELFGRIAALQTSADKGLFKRRFEPA